MNLQTMSGPGVGPHFSNMTCVVYNRTGGAVALGDILMLDHLGTGASTYSDVSLAPNTDVGNASVPAKCWPLGNAITPATTGIGVDVGDPGAIFGVVTNLMIGGGADNTKVELTVAGVVQAKMANVAIVFGDDLYPANNVRTLTNVYAAGVRCLSKALHSGTGQTNWVLFNGMGAPGTQAGDFTP